METVLQSKVAFICILNQSISGMKGCKCSVQGIANVAKLAALATPESLWIETLNFAAY